MDYLIFGGGVGSLFGLLKWIKGEPPTKIFDDGNGKYRVYRGDKYYEAEQKVIQLYQDYEYAASRVSLSGRTESYILRFPSLLSIQ